MSKHKLDNVAFIIIYFNKSRVGVFDRELMGIHI